MRFLDAFRDVESVRRLAAEIASLGPGRSVRLMHVCGTHENALCRWGLRDILPPWLKLIAGPGCPVCVCPAADIDMAVRVAADHGAILATFGDVVRVPARQTLMQAKAAGADIRVVYSISDAISIAASEPSRVVVFFAVGFETTACTTAAALTKATPNNFFVLSSHRVIPTALDALLSIPGPRLDGFLMPGHVMTVTGTKAFRDIAARFNVPMVVGGFEPVDIMLAVKELVLMVKDGRAEVGNAYTRSVRAHGNEVAITAMEKVFEVRDAAWRGIGTIKASGLAIRPELSHKDAMVRFGLQPDDTIPDTEPGCQCGEVLLGRLEPEDCPLFSTVCNTEHPVGPCMVSFEGTCAARYRHGVRR